MNIQRSLSLVENKRLDLPSTVAHGASLASSSEYVKLNIKIQFQHGLIVLGKLKFMLLDKQGKQDWDIYLGIPVLAHLGALPEQILNKYILGKQIRN